MMRFHVPAFLLTLLAGLLFGSMLGAADLTTFPVDQTNRAYVNVGDTAPNFTKPLTKGTFTLYDYAGHVIFLNIWSNT